MTLKEIQALTSPNKYGRYISTGVSTALSKGKQYPYAEVSSKLNNLSVEELNKIDKIVAEGEISSMKMVGIKKLYNMVKTQYVKDKMKEIYNL